MTAGFQQFASGALLVDLTDRLSRQLGGGPVSTGTSAGSITDAALQTPGTPWAVALSKSTSGGAGAPTSPIISFNQGAGTMSWTAPSVDHFILYGIY